MNMTRFLLTGLVMATLAISACKKDTIPEPDPVPTPGGGGNTTQGPVGGNTVRISMKNKVGNDSMMLGNSPLRYINASGDSFSIRIYKYYISNIKLTNANGDVWAEPNSYHFVDASVASTLTFDLTGVPAGNYTGMTFLIGVDSTRNVSGAQTGALDPLNGMFWTWNTGYIMAKLEGKAPNSNSAGDNIVFHIGGFSGQYNSLRWAMPSFGTATANVSTTSGPVITLKSDALNWFTGVSDLNFGAVSNLMTPNANMMLVADNYANMFSVLNIQN